MGLSSKQVSSDGHGWSQTLLQANTLPTSMKRPPLQQQQTEQLNCPRCDSKNTKFCYYNNYNKSQPRHFCKTCKRHWTKGGTLRNVPVGGGRKNKRLKTTNTAVAVQSQQQRQNLNPFANQALIHPPTPSNMGSFISQSLNIIPYASTTTSFNTTPSSISTSFQLSNVIDCYAGESLEEATDIINTESMPMTQPWQIASTSSGMDNNMLSYWNWNDIDTFVSTDLNIPWDDSDIKP